MSDVEEEEAPSPVEEVHLVEGVDPRDADLAELPAAPHSDAVLQLRDFRVSFKTLFGEVQAVRGVDLDVGAGEMLGIVGESGSGKSVTFLGLMGLLPKSARIAGSATVGGTELVGASPKLINRVRGQRVAMIFQDPLSALNPVHKIGDQIVEMIQSHQKMPNKAAWEKSVELLDIVGIPQPETGPASTRTSSRAACASG